jgi:hypothetical protein
MIKLIALVGGTVAAAAVGFYLWPTEPPVEIDTSRPRASTSRLTLPEKTPQQRINEAFGCIRLRELGIDCEQLDSKPQAVSGATR